MSNKIVGLDGQPVDAPETPTPVFEWKITRKDGTEQTARGFLNILGGFYPSICRENGDRVEVVYMVHPEQMVDIVNLG